MTAAHNDVGTLATRAMLIDLTISCWVARKQDKKATRDAVMANQASENAGKFHKRLIDVDNAPTYMAVTEAARHIREFHYQNTLPWTNAARVLPAKNYMAYMQGLRGLRAKFDAAIDLFIEDAPQLREQAKKMLGDMWQDSEFPTANDLRAKFDVEIDVYPLPDAGDFRVHLGDVEVEAMRQKITDSVSRATNQAMTECWDRLHKVVANMAQRLAAPKGIFRDSLVENITELCDLLPSLNLTGDPVLEQMRADVVRDLTVYAPEALREDNQLRAQTAAKANDLVKRMAGIMGGA